MPSASRCSRRGELPPEDADLDLLRAQVRKDQHETSWSWWLLPASSMVGAGVALLDHRSFPGHLELLAAGWFRFLGSVTLVPARRRRRADLVLAERLGVSEVGQTSSRTAAGIALRPVRALSREPPVPAPPPDRSRRVHRRPRRRRVS